MKKRLDILITEKGLAPSREKARAMIMEGHVYVNGEREEKAGSQFAEDVSIEVRGRTLPYVSRGGLKLEKAIDEFGLKLDGFVCLDIGCSTGGFTDCMLQNGASKVFAVDVGYGQLDWKLRNDSRVVCMEKTNARYLRPEDIGEPVDFFSADVSFISLTKILPSVRELAKEGAEAVLLIKPQFEAGKDKVGKKGVVRDPEVHKEVIRGIVSFSSENGFEPLGLSFSPIRGPEGNIEYLYYLKKTGPENKAAGIPEDDREDLILKTVASAHDAFE